MIACDSGTAPVCEPGVRVPGACPAETVKVTWEDWMFINLLWPLAVHISLSFLVSITVRPLQRRVYKQNIGGFRDFMKQYIGTKDQASVEHGGYMVLICCTQFASSVAIMIVWIVNVYRRSVTSGAQTLMFAASIIDLMNWAIHRTQGSWSFSSSCEPNSIIDFLTIIPAIGQIFRLGRTNTCTGNWLSLHFLRSYSLLYNFMQIRATGQLRHSGVLAQMVMLAILRIVALIFIMAGTIFTLEILGDPAILADNFVLTLGGDNISFFQMVYWIVISITTVGYGDFAPRTMLSRIFTMFFVVTGVAYVFWVQFQFQQAWVMNREGSGTYQPRKGEQHVVVVLCHRGRTKVFTSLIGGFLDEILHNSHLNWPNVVIFSHSLWDEDDSRSNMVARFNDFLRERGYPGYMRNRVWFIVGEMANKRDLDRAAVGSSQLTFLIPDINTTTPDNDDETNIFASLVVRDYFPDTRLRLMLLRPQSKDIAVQAGIEMARCFSLRELKAHIFAQNVRCHGMLPLITGLLKSADAHDEEVAMRYEGWRSRRESQCSAEEVSKEPTDEVPWMMQYVHGLQRSLHGFELAEEHGGLHFGELVSRIYETSGALVIGAVQDGRIQICPQNEEGIPARTICFAVTSCAESLEPARVHDKDADHWRKSLLQMRDQQLKRTRREGPHVVAKQLLGATLREALNSRYNTNPIADDHLDSEEYTISDDSAAEDTSSQVHRSASKQSLGGSSVLSSLPPVGSRNSNGASSKRRKSANAIGLGLDGGFKPEPISECINGFGRTLMPASNPLQERRFSGDMTGIATRNSLRSLRARAPSTIGGEADRNFSKERGRSMSRIVSMADVQPRAEDLVLHEVRRMRNSLIPGEELVLLVVCHGEVWQQVRTFVGAMRAKYVSVVRPIIIMTPTAMPANLLDGVSERVISIQGTCTKVQQLVEAGMLEASSIVVMTGEVDMNARAFEEALYKDTKVSLCSQVIECWCGISPREVFTTYELQDSQSASHLPNLMLKPAVNVETMVNELSLADMDDLDDPNLVQQMSQRSHRDKGDFGLNEHKKDPKDKDDKEEVMHAPSILFNARFAAGQIFTPELWGAMLGRMYYMPAIIELVEALVMPHRRGQRSYPWQISVPPKYVGQPFVQLVRDIASTAWVDDAELPKRTRTSSSNHPELKQPTRRASLAGNFTNKMMSAAQATVTPVFVPRVLAGKPTTKRSDPHNIGPACALALYRKRNRMNSTTMAASSSFQPAVGTGGFNYIVLVPSQDTVMSSDDWVLVLGSRKFGRKALQMGLLRGAAHQTTTTATKPEEGTFATPYRSESEPSPSKEQGLKDLPPTINNFQAALNGETHNGTANGASTVIDVNMDPQQAKMIQPETTEAAPEPEVHQVHHVGRPSKAPPEPFAPLCAAWSVVQEPERSEL